MSLAVMMRARPPSFLMKITGQVTTRFRLSVDPINVFASDLTFLQSTELRRRQEYLLYFIGANTVLRLDLFDDISKPYEARNPHLTQF